MTPEQELQTPHHPLSPSNYPAFYHCGDYEGASGSSESAQTGTAVHKLFEELCRAHNELMESKVVRFNNE